VGTLDCASGLAYVWTIPAALSAYVTTSTTSPRLFSFTGSNTSLATTAGYTITLTATTTAGTALTSGGVSTFALMLQGVASAQDTSTTAVT